LQLLLLAELATETNTDGDANDDKESSYDSPSSRRRVIVIKFFDLLRFIYKVAIDFTLACIFINYNNRLNPQLLSDELGGLEFVG